ncbi:hypothetical protein ACFT9M_13555 [Micromonospora purpureochromogenes]|uniref:hypothetical protein n=1 Tax=Micromonospora purpureochromogenes TaxID=47872 RepID=UPI0036384E27
MTDDPPSTPAARDPYAVASADEPIRVPSWMVEPETEHELTRGERLRLTWETHSGKVLGGVVALVALGLVTLLGVGGVGFVERVRDGESPIPGRAAGRPPAPRPTDESGNSLGPYVATPAEAFAEGEAAIVLPAAKATGPFTAKQVADGLAAVKRALVEGRLAPRMLRGEPDLFLAQLAPDARADIRADLADGANLGYATRIADGADPGLNAGESIRARGTLEYRATTLANGVRVLEITTRHIWVYPFELWLPQRYPPGAELVTVRDEVVWQLTHPDDVRPAARGLWIDAADATLQNASCAGIEQGYVALADKEQPRRRTAPAPTGDVYDDNWRAGEGEDC